jgi:hypothetical protein
LSPNEDGAIDGKGVCPGDATRTFGMTEDSSGELGEPGRGEPPGTALAGEHLRGI